MKKVLVVVAHPDDETLGCGGTIAKHIAEGDEVYCIVMTDNFRSPRIFEYACKAMDILGIKNRYFIGLKDSQLERLTMLDLAREIEQVIEVKGVGIPDIIYTHYEYDLSIDHRLTFQAILTTFRPVWGKPVSILSFEVASGTEWASQSQVFAPNVFVDIRDYLGKKLDAYAEYKTEIRESPHPRSESSLTARAKYWGVFAGLEFAEPFKLIREVRG